MTTATAADYATQINQAFSRLNVDTDVNPYSGLMAENVSPTVVKIFDDYASGEYYAVQALAALEECEPINLEEETDFQDIWQALRKAEVE